MNGDSNITNDIFKGISGILWFFYRVLFTMIPTAAFLILLYELFTYYYSSGRLAFNDSVIKTVFEAFDRRSSGNQVIIILILIGFLNIILEAVVIKLAYRLLGFSKFCADMFSVLLYDNFSSKLRRMKSPIPMFNLIYTHSLIKDSKVFEHIQYVLAREFLFNNTWILLLSIMTFIAPACIHLQYPQINIPLNILIPVQFLVACAWAKGAMWMVKFTKKNLQNMMLSESDAYNLQVALEDVKEEDIEAVTVKKTHELNVNKENSRKVVIILTVTFTVSLFLIFSGSHHPFLLLTGIDLCMFVLCFFLISSAFREYMSIEGIVHFYYVLQKKDILNS